jgi:hypothetical protein
MCILVFIYDVYVEFVVVMVVMMVVVAVMVLQIEPTGRGGEYPKTRK